MRDQPCLNADFGYWTRRLAAASTIVPPNLVLAESAVRSSSGMRVRAEGAAEAVTPVDVQMGESIWVGDRFGQRREWPEAGAYRWRRSR